MQTDMCVCSFSVFMKAVRRCDKRMTTELDISALYDAVHEAESRNSKCTVVGRNNYSGYAKKTDNCSMPAANNVPPKQLLMYLVR